MMDTLSPQKAHNAAAALIEMYHSIIRDFERRELIYTSRITMLESQLKEARVALHSGNALQKPSATESFSREVESRGDQRVNGQGMGSSQQGEEASEGSEEQARKVGK